MASYSLDTGKLYIKDVFAADSFYNIPEYQRPYVWGDEQVEALLDDISSAMEQDSKKEYFIGCMIWNTKMVRDGEFEYKSQDILDGQQRFITLYLLQGILRDISDNDDLKRKVAERIQQVEDVFDGIPERNRIEFEIRPDSEFLERHILSIGGTNDLHALEKIATNPDEETSVQNMANAILAMRAWWDKKSQKLDDFQTYVKQFYSFLSSQVLTLYLATPDNLDDAYNLFTVLNSRGLQLQVSDILRAQNLRQIQEPKARRNYARKWSDYENSIGLPYQSFDDFLWAIVFMKMKYRSDDNKSLNAAFNFMYGRGMLERGSKTFDHIGKYVAHYRAIFDDSIQSDSIGSYFINLNQILATTFGNRYLAPLMHYRECFGEYKITEFLIRIDNLFSASWLTGKRNLQTRIFMMLRKMDEIHLRSGKSSEAAELFLQDEVLDYDYQDENAATSIDIDELFALFDQERWGSFSGSRINKTRYILLKLDLISSNMNNRLLFDPSKSSVEHLMPRRPEPDVWTVDNGGHEQWLHRLGNIVLLDRKKNTALSNSAYAIKREKYRSSFENRPNTNFVLMSYNSWNLDTIVNNHERSLDNLRRYYLGNSLETVRQIQKSNENTQPVLL